VVVIADDDQQGAHIRKCCEKEKAPFLAVDEFCESHHGNKSIENVLGMDFYLDAVNDWYRRFEWFRPMDMQKTRKELGHMSLGSFLVKAFEDRFEGRGFDKIGVMISIVDNLRNVPEPVFARLQSLFERINSLMAG
jgi:hypothetical protein